ncbi:MAG: hypothetical protein LBE39_09525 [Flavobacteriaceae bacterium]|jgi:hypothetical protein|nr:hypothetical protein [Flavobacteriaceae bacterium]
MENKKATSIIFATIAIILGFTLYKQFDFQTFKFEKPALAPIYATVFFASIFFLARNTKKK